VTSITDPNSQMTTKAYDILTRLTKVNTTVRLKLEQNQLISVFA
jgi:hypothetical protein